MTNSIPNRLGKYEIIGEIGRGGFAAVYEAVDTTLDRTVALKVLAPHLLWDPSFLERFQQEAKLAANLKHPNIVVIYEFGTLEGVVYITMEYLSGQNLAGLVREEGALAPSRILRITSQVASALDYAHSQGLVHRDIKPSNLMIGAGDHITVTDFGIAKAAAATALTTTGKIFGTPEYMSPEQAMGTRELDARSDNYSLGVVVYQMFTGQVPFSGETPLGMMRCHVDEPPPPPSQINPAIPPAVEAVLLKALAKEREKRYQRAGDTVLALEEALREEAEDKERAEARVREERARQEQIATLYEQALELARARQWRPALAKMGESQTLDPQFADPEGIAARAREEVAREEETQRQNELAALYAEAVRLLRAGQYQEALEKWEEVQARAPRYPDRQNVQATARKKLEALAEAAPPRRGLSRWIFAAIGGLVLVVIVVVVVLLINPITPTPSPVPYRDRIAFHSDRDGNREIYVMNTDGSGQTNLTNNPADDWGPSWSPDGRLVFVSDRDGNREIYVMNADGSGVTRLTNNLAHDQDPSWSPDGGHIAFKSERDGKEEIYVMNADGSGQTRLTDNPADDWGPSWSPDGRRIAFISNRAGNYEIYVMNADGSGVTRLTNNPADDLFSPWSPDGERIAFTYTEDWEIYVMNADGSGQTRLTNNPASDWGPSWSPDGSRIAFVSYRDGNDEIYIMNADGSEQTNLTNNPAQDQWPSWGP